MTGRSIARLGDYVLLAYFSLSRLGHLRQHLLRDQFNRQLHAAGISALPVVAILAALAGATSVTQISALAGPDSDLAQRLLFFGLFFELAPLLCAIVIVARSSAAVASELAVMRIHNEYAALRRLGLHPAEYLLLPRIAAMSIALPMVTVIFQVVAMCSGWLAVALLHGRPLPDIAAHFLAMASPGVILLALAKSLVMGAVVGVVAAHHGSSADKTSHSVSDAAIQAVGSGMVAVFIVDILFAGTMYLLK